jgi:molybdenum cofactor guanylyltransferase
MTGFTGILLCGGKSQRMGTDKALLKLNRQPMLLYPLKILQQWCNEILISSNNDQLNFLGYPVIADEIKDIGPMGGLYSCIKQSTNPYSLLLACDMPLITGELLEKMIPQNERYDVIAPMANGRAEPLYALYHKHIIKKIEQHIFSNTFALQKLLSDLNVHYVKASADINELFNANTPHELEVYGQITKDNLS